MNTPRSVAIAVVSVVCAAPILAAPTAAAPGPVYGATWTVDTGANSLSEYAPGASGAASPLATITGATTGLDAPTGVVVSSQGNVFVSNAGNDSITEYPPGVTGDAPAKATIKGSATGLAAPSSISLAEGELWVSDPATNTVEAFTAGSKGNELPAETIAGPKTGLDHPVGVASDAQGGLAGLLGLSSIDVINAPAKGPGSLLIFSVQKLGDVAPGATITSSKKGPLRRPTSILAEGLGEIWVTDATSNAVSEFVAFPAIPELGGQSLSGVVRSISGSATDLDSPSAVTLDALEQPVVANAGDHTLRVFKLSAKGDVAPLRTISGVGTDAGSPEGASVLGIKPGTPTDVQVVMDRSNLTATLSWKRPAFTGGGVVGYDLIAVRTESEGGLGDILELGSELGTRKTTVTKQHLKLGVDYEFEVQAVNAFGASPFTKPVKRAFVTPASAPRKVRALSGKHSIEVTWKQPSSDGGRTIRTYRVEYATCRPGTKACTFHTKVVPGSGLGEEIRGLVADIHGLKGDTKYYSRVIATTRHGLGTPSRVVSVTTQS